MKCNPWVGGSIGRRGFPMLGTGKRGLSTYVKELFKNGEQGFFYDPNDLTEGKLKWRRNLLLYTQSFTNNIYTKIDATLSVGELAPDGTATATKVIPNVVNTTYHGIYCVIHNSMQVGKVYTVSVYAKAAEYGVLRLSDTANASFGMLFDLRKGTMSNDAAANIASNMTGAIEAVGNGWYRCSIQFTAIGQPPAITATRTITVGVFDTVIASYAGNGVSGLHIWGLQLEEGSLTPYQALTDFNTEFVKAFPLHTLYQDVAGTVPVTAVGQPVGLIRDKSGRNNHAYQTNSASRPILRQNAITGAYYLEFDGSDDFFVTNSIDFTSTDKISLFAGVRKLSDANSAILLELSADLNYNIGSFYLAAPLNASTKSFAFMSRGTIASGTTALSTNNAAPYSAVITAKGNIAASSISLRSNGVLFNGSVALGTGNYGNYPLYIGRRAGTSLPFTGHIYSLIGVGKLASDSETAAIEKELAKRTGVTLNV